MPQHGGDILKTFLTANDKLDSKQVTKGIKNRKNLSRDKIQHAEVLNLLNAKHLTYAVNRVISLTEGLPPNNSQQNICPVRRDE